MTSPENEDLDLDEEDEQEQHQEQNHEQDEEHVEEQCLEDEQEESNTLRSSQVAAEEEEEEDEDDDEEDDYGEPTEDVDENDDEQERRIDESDDVQYSRVLVAMPPPRLLSTFDDSRVEVASSPAFCELDKLFAEGKLSATKLALLKSKFTELHESLKSRRNNEQTLLLEAKNCANLLEQQKRQLILADEFPDNSNTEVTSLRETLLNHSNDLLQTEERNYQLAYTIECLQEDKRMLQKEAERLPKQGEMEKRLEDLKLSCTDLKKEINQRKQEVKTLKEDLDNMNRQHQLANKSYENTRDDVDKYQSDLVAVNSQPSTIAKECDRIQRHKNDTEKSLAECDAQIKSLRAQIESTQMRIASLEEEKFNMERMAREKGAQYFEREKSFQAFIKDYEYVKQKETLFISDRATLDLNLKHIAVEYDSAHEIHSRKLREKERDLQNLKRAELQLKVVQDGLERVQASYTKKQQEAGALPKNTDEMTRTIEKLNKEVDHSRRAIAIQNGVGGRERLKLDQSIAAGERLLYELSDLKVEIVELNRLTSIKTEEKLQKGRDLREAEQKYIETRQELMTKNIVLSDHKKKEREMLSKLKEFSSLYDIIKSERNRCVSLIQSSAQKLTEMSEKIKILANELELLRASANQKERLLQKERMKQTHGLVVCDSLRAEMCKRQKTLNELRAIRDQHAIDLDRLEGQNKRLEEQMTGFRKRYEIEVKNRNDRGIQLIERNQEVCIFYEKVNIQDTVSRNGNVELQSREEELRFLQMQLKEEKRTIELLRKTLPNKRALEKELVTLQIQLSQCQDRTMVLERQVENPTEDRVRFIGGKELTAIELQDKLEELESRLAKKEEQSLEKDLVLDQVTRLTDRVDKKVGADKEDTLAVSKRLNGYQSRIKTLTRRMMATVAELSMHQAQALRLQQEVQEKEALLEECYRNMERGEAPCPEMEQDWMRMVRDEQMRLTAKQTYKSILEQEEMTMLPGGYTSTAEQRPNAYIPLEQHELPIPRPYGGHAPFKPTEPGSNMRHIRKPVPKPIEI